jgi:lipoyl(octanoyl) transferase
MNSVLMAQWLGLQNYSAIEAQQKALVGGLAGQSKILLLGMEFNAVLTLGVRGNATVDLMADENQLRSRGLDIVTTDRGGQATIHSPGQLVIYPMLDLRIYHLGVKEFVHRLMTCTVKTLANYGLPAGFSAQNPGVYSSFGKIAFCGLRSDRGVVRHGISINIGNDLALFEGVRSCGHSQPRLDRVARVSSVTTKEFFHRWCESFRADFQLSAPQSIDMSV